MVIECFTLGLILDEISFDFFVYNIKLVFTIFLIHVLPIVTAKRSDSRARIYDLKFVFFWKTRNRNHIPSWNVVIIQQESTFIKGLEVSLVHSTYSVSMSEYYR